MAVWVFKFPREGYKIRYQFQIILTQKIDTESYFFIFFDKLALHLLTKKQYFLLRMLIFCQKCNSIFYPSLENQTTHIAILPNKAMKRMKISTFSCSSQKTQVYLLLCIKIPILSFLDQALDMPQSELVIDTIKILKKNCGLKEIQKKVCIYIKIAIILSPHFIDSYTKNERKQAMLLFFKTKAIESFYEDPFLFLCTCVLIRYFLKFSHFRSMNVSQIYLEKAAMKTLLSRHLLMTLNPTYF